jgi:hypothetical protein
VIAATPEKPVTTVLVESLTRTIDERAEFIMFDRQEHVCVLFRSIGYDAWLHPTLPDTVVVRLENKRDLIP